MADPSEPLSVESLAQLEQEKEAEWRGLQQLRIETAMKSQKERERELQQEKEKLAELTDDFKYNLGLLEERDKEMDALTAVIETLKREMLKKEIEISDLRVVLDSEREKMAAAEREAEEMKARFQKQIKTRQKEMEAMTRDKEAEVKKEREEMETLKRQLKQRFVDMEDDLETQRRQLTQSFDDAMKKHDSDWRAKNETLEAKIMADELKIRQLGYEVELLRGSLEAKGQEDEGRALEKEEKEREVEKLKWELQSVSAVKDARIKELETSIKKNYADDRAKSEEHERKRNDSSRKLLEKQGQLEAVKKSHEEQLQQAEGKLLELEAKLDRNEQERRQLEWSKEDVIGDKEKEVGILKMKLEKQGKDVEMKLVDGMNERSSELKRTKDYLKKIMGERDQAKEDLDWYKRELATAGSRTEEMGKKNTQMEFDFEERLDEVRRKEIVRNEDLIRNLTKQRDDAQAKCDEMRERVKRYRVSAGGDQGDDMHDILNPRDDVIELKQENERLKLVIQTMREQSELMALEVDDKQMQQPVHVGQSQSAMNQQKQQQPMQQPVIHPMQQPHLTKRQPDDQKNPVISSDSESSLMPDYVKYLENEVRRLKKENTEWAEKVELIKGAANATRRALPVCKCALEPNRDLRPRKNLKPGSDDVSGELWSIIQRQKKKIEDLKAEKNSTGNDAKRKLKEAVQTIRALVHQKHKLIENNNKLRSELALFMSKEAKDPYCDANDTPAAVSPEKAEQMQYQLTKEQLKFAAGVKPQLFRTDSSGSEQVEPVLDQVEPVKDKNTTTSVSAPPRTATPGNQQSAQAKTTSNIPVPTLNQKPKSVSSAPNPYSSLVNPSFTSTVTNIPSIPNIIVSRTVAHEVPVRDTHESRVTLGITGGNSFEVTGAKAGLNAGGSVPLSSDRPNQKNPNEKSTRPTPNQKQKQSSKQTIPKKQALLKQNRFLPSGEAGKRQSPKIDSLQPTMGQMQPPLITYVAPEVTLEPSTRTVNAIPTPRVANRVSFQTNDTASTNEQLMSSTLTGESSLQDVWNILDSSLQ